MSHSGTAHDLDPYVAVSVANSVGAVIRLSRQRRGAARKGFDAPPGTGRSAITLLETGRLARIASAPDVPVAVLVAGMAPSDLTPTLAVNGYAPATARSGSDATVRTELLRAAERLESQSRERRPRAPPSGL